MANMNGEYERYGSQLSTRFSIVFPYTGLGKSLYVSWLKIWPLYCLLHEFKLDFFKNQNRIFKWQCSFSSISQWIFVCLRVRLKYLPLQVKRSRNVFLCMLQRFFFLVREKKSCVCFLPKKRKQIIWKYLKTSRNINIKYFKTWLKNNYSE